MKYLYSILFIFISIFSFAQPNTDVFLFDLEIDNNKFTLSNFKNISNNEGYDNQPSFLDNNTIVFSSTRDKQTDIVKYNIPSNTKTWLSSTQSSEYSPLKIPGKNAVSAIRQGLDNSQHLYSYNLKDGTSTPVIENLVIGYHVWSNSNSIVTSILESEFLSLAHYNLMTMKHDTIARNVGRSLHKIPNSNLISYISKANENWEIRSYNPQTENNKLISSTLKNVEDMCWTPEGNILMGKDVNLYFFNSKTNSEWKKIASLEKYGIEKITRIIVSPDGKKIAIVGEKIDLNKTLEPKLENISWISGNWKGEAFGGIVEENWSEPSGDSMMATFKLINDNKVSFYEIEIIREIENSLILQLKHFGNDLKGWETKDETVDFPLKEITRNKVVFEGMSFERINENEMNVYVDLKQKDGSVKTMKFNYKK